MSNAESRSSESARTRDHLANERTYLAWIRTALGLVGLGFVLARMGLFLRQLAALGDPNRPHGENTVHEFLVAGLVFLFFGTVLCGWSGWHYRRTLRAIETGRYEPAGRAVLTLTIISVVGGALIFVLVAWRILA